MNYVTLTGRGVTLTLFAPRFDAESVSASAVMVDAPLTRSRILKHGKDKFRAPAIPGAGFYLAEITLPRCE